MKNFRVVLLFIFALTNLVRAQQPAPKRATAASVSNLVSYLDHDTCIDKQFSIVFYIVLDSNYSVVPATQPTIDAVMNALNAAFKPICVSFANCSTVLIPNYPYNKWKKYITEPVVTQNWYTENTINIYLVDSIKNNPEIFGYADGPTIVPFSPAPAVPTRTDVIVLEKGYLNMPNNFSVLHHMGHFFGLPHTGDEIGTNTSTVTPQSPVNSFEFVDGSNCADHGDGFCDTEADGNSITSFVDGKGDYYIPPLDNFMSFYLSGCRYTHQQYNYMARIICTRRLYLH